MFFSDEMKKRYLINSAFIIALVVAVSALNQLVKVNESTEIPVQASSFAGVSGNIVTYFCTEFKPASSDKWINLGCVHNVFTNAGRNHVKGVLGGEITTGIPIKYLALGNGSAPTATSTSLDGEITTCGLARTLGDYYSLGVGWWEINTTFTYTCSTPLTVNTTGAFNQPTGGTFFAGGTITPVTFTTNGDQLRLRHNYTITEG